MHLARYRLLFGFCSWQKLRATLKWFILVSQSIVWKQSQRNAFGVIRKSKEVIQVGIIVLVQLRMTLYVHYLLKILLK